MLLLTTHPSLVESTIEKEVMASNVIGIINLFISILFKYSTCLLEKEFHQTMLLSILYPIRAIRALGLIEYCGL